jgi:hypothetical protein
MPQATPFRTPGWTLSPTVPPVPTPNDPKEEHRSLIAAARGVRATVAPIVDVEEVVDGVRWRAVLHGHEVVDVRPERGEPYFFGVDLVHPERGQLPRLATVFKEPRAATFWKLEPGYTGQLMRITELAKHGATDEVLDRLEAALRASGADRIPHARFLHRAEELYNERRRLYANRHPPDLTPLEVAVLNALYDETYLRAGEILAAVKKALPRTQIGKVNLALRQLDDAHFVHQTGARSALVQSSMRIWRWGESPHSLAVKLAQAEVLAAEKAGPRAVSFASGTHLDVLGAAVGVARRPFLPEITQPTEVLVGGFVRLHGDLGPSGAPCHFPPDTAEDLAAGRTWLVVTDGERALRLHPQADGAWMTTPSPIAFAPRRFDLVPARAPKYVYPA